MIIIYKRPIDKKLLSLRVSFFILTAICLLSFIYYYDKLGTSIALVIVFMSIIVIKDFAVSPDSFQISKFYFFGLIKKTWLFKKGENIKVISISLDFGEDGDVPDIADESAVGCLFSIFSIFQPPKITRRKFRITKLNENNIHLYSVNILLDRSEFNYLKTF